MNKAQLTDIIRVEVQKVVRAELPKIIRPMVAEAVAGALANLLAEGIVKGPPPKPQPKVLTPNIPQARRPAPPPAKSGLTDSARRTLAAKMGYGQIDQISIPSSPNSGNMIDDILSETAQSMATNGPVDVPSVLDSPDQLSEISPDIVNVITRDYSDLMKSMNNRGKLNG